MQGKSWTGTAARTIDEHKAEIETLRRLENLALTVRRSGEDCKWRELANLLSEIFTPAAIANHLADGPASYKTDNTPKPSPRQKIVIFTEHRDTLNYLEKEFPHSSGAVQPWLPFTAAWAVRNG